MRKISVLVSFLTCALGLSAQVTTFPYIEDFEASDGGWTSSGTNNSWEHGSPSGTFINQAGPCGVNAWVTNLDGNYNNSEQSNVTSPMMDFSSMTSDPFLRFDHIYETEGCCDEGWVEYSDDNGTTWNKLGTSSSGIANWYNDSGNDWWDGSSGASGEWRTAAHQLTGLAGQDSIRIRFVFDSDGSATEDGFGIDNILIFESLNDATASQVIAPSGSSSFTATETVTASFQNFGTDTITSIQLCYVLNNGTPVCETFTVNVLPTQLDTVSFTQTADVSALGAFGIVVYTNLTGDSFNCNDTASTQGSTIPYISTFPYFEDFETNDGYWASSGSNSSWEHGMPSGTVISGASDCGVNAWVTNLDGSYNSSENSFITSPMMDFTSMTTDPILRFDHIYETESCCDEGWVEYSTDGGNNWTKLGSSATGIANWYNDAGNDWWDGTSGSPAGWRIAAHQLTGLAGEDSVRIRFAISTDGSVTREGFGVDNIFVFENLDDVFASEIIAPSGSQPFGATETVTASFQNIGTTAVTSVELCYVLNNGTPVCETFTVNVAPLGIDTVSFTQTMDISAIDTHDIVVYTNLTGDDFVCNDTIASQVITVANGLSTFPYVEDFETSDGGWVASGNNNSWEYGVPAGTLIPQSAGCGVNAWVTNLDGSYNSSEQSFITSPLFDFSALTSDPILRFDHIYETEGCCDEGWVEYSTDGGATWTKLGTSTSGIANWYNDAGNDWWDGSSGGTGDWRLAMHELTGLAGEAAVRIRFAISTDGSVTREGFGVDNVFIFESLTDVLASEIIAPSGSQAFGATETLTASFLNIGTDTITSVQLCYVINNGTPVCETFTVNALPFELDTVSFTQTIDISAIDTHDIVVYTNLAGDADVCNDTTSSEVITVASGLAVYPYIEDFETSDGGWVASGNNSSWEYGVPAGTVIPQSAGCGVNAWVTNLDGDYNNNESSYITSPLFDFSGLTTDPYLRFDHIYETESCCDEGWVEYSTDGGATWTKLGTSTSGLINWYNDAGNDWWDGNSGAAGVWRLAAHELTGLAGESSVRIRFAFDSDGSAVREGFGVDNVAIYETYNDAAAAGLVSPSGSNAFTANQTVSVSVANYGSDTVTSVEVCYVLGTASPVCETFTVSIPPFGLDTVSFTQTADISAIQDHDFTVYTNLTGENNPCNDTIQETVTTIMLVSSFPYFQDFEVSDGGWATNGSNSTWELGAPLGTYIASAARCGNTSWVTNLDGNYNSNELSYVESPIFDFTTVTDTMMLSFDHIFQTEGCCDEGWVEYSTNSGATYVKLGTSLSGELNWYNDAGNDWWDGNSGTADTWRTAAHNLGALIGQDSVRFRFVFSSDGSVTEEGFGVDNIMIQNSGFTDMAIRTDSIVSPVSGCSGSNAEVVTFFVSNLGLDTISSLPVCYTVNGGTPVCETITVSIAPSDTATVSFTQTVDFSTPGAYTLEIYGNSIAELFTCNDTAMFTFQVPVPILIAGTVDSTVSCNGLSDGGVSVSVGGGTAPYSYLWNNADTTSSLTGVGAGSYTVTITDANGCTAADTLVVTEPTPIVISLTNTDVNCYGDATGESSATGGISGGTAPYTYDWSNGGTSEEITGLTAGDYTVTVTDANGCSNTASATITENDSITLQLNAIDATCESSDDGSVATVVSGGSPAYTYSWNTGSTADSIGDLVAGSYTVTVTDQVGCEKVATADVDFTNANPVVNLGADTSVGPGFVMNLNSGYPSATNLWSTGESTEAIEVTVVSDTTVWVQVTSAEGCIGSDTIVIGALLSANSVVLEGMIQLYPNPTDDRLTVNIEGVQADEVTIQVLNFNGQLMEEQRINNIASRHQSELSLGKYSTGVYFINVIVDGNRYTQRVTVK